MAGPSSWPPGRPLSEVERLDSWKEIAAYLKRSLRTVQRWEKHEGLPVYRHTHDKLGSVYAYPAELDEWWRDRRPRLEVVETVPLWRPTWPRAWVWLGIMAFVFTSVVLRIVRTRSQPFERFTITRLTTTGTASRAAISPDGRYLAYVVGDLGEHGMRLRDLVTGSDGYILPAAAVVYGGITFSGDGKLLYYNVTKSGETSAALYRTALLNPTPQKLKENLSSPAALSPDGSRVAFVREDRALNTSTLIVADLNGSAERTIAARDFPDFLDYPTWSPTGRTIAFTSVAPRTASVKIQEIDLAAGTERPLSARPWPYARQLQWLPDGKGLVFTALEAAGAPYSLWYLNYASGKAKKVNSDLDDFGNTISVAADSRRIAIVQDKLISSLWLAPSDDPASARQIAYDTSRFSQASLAPDGSIFLEKQEGGRRSIWVIQPDGSAQKQLTVGGNNYDATVCPAGPYVVYTCEQRGFKGVCRMNQDGSGHRQLLPSTLVEIAARCSPDGRDLIYSTSSTGKWTTLWKMPIDGGAAQQLTDKLCSRPAISPDGRRVVCFYTETPSAQAEPDKIAILPISGGAPVKLFPLPATAYSQGPLRWTPDGSAIAYIDNRGGVSNIWIQRLHGEASQLTNFRGDRIFSFEWSPDGRQIAFSRGTRSHDVFLIRDLR